MKIYFDGCSWTYGSELSDPEKTRWTKIVSDHYDAKEYNISKSGGCNRRIVRNLLEHNIDDYDVFIIQMSMNLRTEYYNGNEWVGLTPSGYYNSNKWVSLTSNAPKNKNIEIINYTKNYYTKIYDPEFGNTDDKIYYTLIRKLLKNKKHLLIGIDRGKSQSKVSLDMDISLMLDDSIKRRESLKLLGKQPPYPRDPKHYRCKGMHPNEEGHEIIARYIINALDSEDYKKNAISSHDKGWWSTLDHAGDIKRMITKSLDNA